MSILSSSLPPGVDDISMLPLELKSSKEEVLFFFWPSDLLRESKYISSEELLDSPSDSLCPSTASCKLSVE